MSEEFKERRRAEFQTLTTKDPEEIFRLGWLMGMQKAVEIEDSRHQAPPRRKTSK